MHNPLRLLFCFSSLFTVVVLITACEPAETPTPYSPTTSAVAPPGRVVSAADFPPGFDYPLSADTLMQMVMDNDLAAMRTHGWYLFAGMHLNGTTGPQLWEDWYSLPATFAPDKPLQPVGAAAPAKRHNRREIAQQGSHAIANAPKYKDSCNFGGERFLDNGDIMIAGVYYNQSAYQYVRDTGYYKKSVLQQLRTQSPQKFMPFPATSFSIKHMYWPVKADGLTALPVIDYNPVSDPADPAAPINPPDPTAYNGYETWKTAVAIDPSGAAVPSGKTASVSYLYIDDPDFPPRSFADAPVVSINQFYHHQVTQQELDSMNPTDRCILDQSAKWNFNRGFQANDYIVSIAMHIITKEFEPWTMQSYWWNDQPQRGQYSKDRPAIDLAGPWQHYLMCTAYSMVTPREGDGSPLVCSNPYIELVIPETYRTVSNCQNCHVRGAYPAAKSLTDVSSPDAHYDSERRGEIPYDDPIFNGLLRTDFSWSIPLSAVDE